MWCTCLLLALAVGSPTGDLIPEGNATEVEIVALYPNTVLDGNRGEFIVVHLPERQHLGDWTFHDDGVQSAKPPPVWASGTIAFSHHPEAAEPYLEIPVYQLDGWLQLAVDGERLTLEIDGIPVDTVSYEGPAPQAHLWVRDRTEPWVALGASAFEPVVAHADVRTFVLPDAPAVVTEAMAAASNRLFLGGYELGDPAVTAALVAAADRGVEVAVHAEGRPVGGIAAPHAAALDALDDAGIPVTVHRGPYARYGYHHPKYVVIDDQVLVTTENFKPAGTGGTASRGWGVIVDSPELADATAAVFEADTGWRDAVAWSAIRTEITRHDDDTTTGDYPAVHQPADYGGVRVELFAAPDNAEAGLIELIDTAERSIHIKQMRIADADFPLLARAIDRARDGVALRVLLADTWYVREDNRAVAAELEAIAAEEGLDIEVALVDDTPAFDRIHAKGFIIDGSLVAVGSVNWNNHSLRQNRELVVAIEDDAVAGYYLAVFEADWPADDTGWQVPLGLVAAVLAAGGLVAEHVRRMRMEDPSVQEDERYTER